MLWCHRTERTESTAQSARGRESRTTSRGTARETARLDVSVISTDENQPVEGADIGIYGAENGKKTSLLGRSDANGAWHVSLAPGRYQLVASSRGYLASRKEVEVSGVANHATVVLRRGGISVHGKVADIGGGPIAGAILSARKPVGGELVGVTTAREDGGYQLALEPGSYQLRASYPGYASAERRIRLSTPHVEDFRLDPSSRIEGTVLSRGDKQPIANVIVRAEHERSSGMNAGAWSAFVAGRVGGDQTVSDEQGHFVFDGLSPGTHTLSAAGRGVGSRHPTTITIALGETRSNVIVYVAPAFSIRGKVVDASSGKGDAGLRVVADNQEGGLRFPATAPSDDNGLFEIAGVPPGRYLVYTLRDSAHLSPATANVTVDAHDVSGIVLDLAAGYRIRGRVQPDGSATVQLSGPPDVGMDEMMTALVAEQTISSQTDDSGAFELSGIPAGRWSITAERDRLSGAAEVEVSADVDDVVVRLSERARVCGRVIDTSGVPVPDAHVTAMPTRGLLSPSEGIARNIRHSMRMDGVDASDDGSFCIGDLDAGSYFLYAMDRVGFLIWGPRHVSHGNLVPLRLAEGEQRTGYLLQVAARNRQIRGRVVDDDGQPIADAYVSAVLTTHFTGDHSVFPDFDQFDSEQSVPTDADGRFVLPHLRPGKYDVTATGHRGEGSRTMAAVSDGAQVELELQGWGTIQGASESAIEPPCRAVLYRDGQPVGSVAGDGARCSFEFARARPGTYTVELLTASGSGTASTKVTAGQHAKVRVDVAGWAEIRGTVTDDNGDPVVGAPVLVVYDSLVPMNLAHELALGRFPRTDASGSFHLTRVRRGPLTVAILTPAGNRPLWGRRVEVDQPQLDLDTISTKP